MFIRLTFVVSLLLTFVRLYDSALNSTASTTAKPTVNSTEATTFFTVHANLYQAEACLKKLIKSGFIAMCHKNAQDSLKTTLAPFEWSKALNGLPFLMKNSSEKECQGLYSEIWCGVTAACDTCSKQQKAVLESFGKGQVMAIKAKYCQQWTQPLNVSSWCDASKSDGMIFVIIMITGMATLLVFACGLIIYSFKREHASATMKNKRRQRRAEPKSISFSLKALSAGLKSKFAGGPKSAVSKAKALNSKVKSAMARGKSSSNKAKSRVKSSVSDAKSRIKSSVVGTKSRVKSSVSDAKSSKADGKSSSNKSRVKVASSTVSSKAKAIQNKA